MRRTIFKGYRSLQKIWAHARQHVTGIQEVYVSAWTKVTQPCHSAGGSPTTHHSSVSASSRSLIKPSTIRPILASSDESVRVAR